MCGNFESHPPGKASPWQRRPDQLSNWLLSPVCLPACPVKARRPSAAAPGSACSCHHCCCCRNITSCQPLLTPSSPHPKPWLSTPPCCYKALRPEL